ncbi:MAG: hypothetical protein HC866_00815 [Leptolyngbyaceae cyanobacterium RU_5_1]|nr:hypothetical protein [Leptolyngbyaceae cyanobacterium RU_5_1]
MNPCPFCSDILLRHVRVGQTYWLCRHCRLEILAIDQASVATLSSAAEISSYSQTQPKVKLDDLSHQVALERGS